MKAVVLTTLFVVVLLFAMCANMLVVLHISKRKIREQWERMNMLLYDVGTINKTLTKVEQNLSLLNDILRHELQGSKKT